MQKLQSGDYKKQIDRFNWQVQILFFIRDRKGKLNFRL